MRLIPIDSRTPFGKVSAIHSSKGERNYFMIMNDGAISLIPEDSMFCSCGKSENRKGVCKNCGWFL